MQLQWIRMKYNWIRILKQFAGYDSDIHVTLKQGPSPETFHKLLDPEQGYNHAKFERPPVNSDRQPKSQL